MNPNSIHTYARKDPEKTDIVPKDVVLWGFPDWDGCKQLVREVCAGNICRPQIPQYFRFILVVVAVPGVV